MWKHNNNKSYIVCKACSYLSSHLTFKTTLKGSQAEQDYCSYFTEKKQRSRDLLQLFKVIKPVDEGDGHTIKVFLPNNHLPQAIQNHKRLSSKHHSFFLHQLPTTYTKLDAGSDARHVEMNSIQSLSPKSMWLQCREKDVWTTSCKLNPMWIKCNYQRYQRGGDFELGVWVEMFQPYTGGEEQSWQEQRQGDSERRDVRQYWKGSAQRWEKGQWEGGKQAGTQGHAKCLEHAGWEEHPLPLRQQHLLIKNQFPKVQHLITQGIQLISVTNAWAHTHWGLCPLDPNHNP